MTARLSPQREAEIAGQIADAIYPTYGQKNRNRSLAIADLIMPAVREAVAAELSAVCAERDALAERVETVRALCDSADAVGIISGGWFTVDNVRKALNAGTEAAR